MKIDLGRMSLISVQIGINILLSFQVPEGYFLNSVFFFFHCSECLFLSKKFWIFFPIYLGPSKYKIK